MVVTAKADAAFFAQKLTFGATGYLVNGASQSGTSLIIDGGADPLHKGQTFSVAGVSGTYTITTVTNATVTDGDYAPSSITTVKFTPALASSPSNNAALTITTAMPLPPHLLTVGVTVLNESSSNDVTVADHASAAYGFKLAAGSAITVDVSDASTIYITGTIGDDVSIIGS